MQRLRVAKAEQGMDGSYVCISIIDLVQIRSLLCDLIGA